MCCRKGGTVSIPGVYIGFLGQDPDGGRHEQGPDLQDGPDPRATLSHRLLKKIQADEIDPSFVITHVLPLEDAPEPTRPFATRKTIASRSCSSPE